MRVSDETLRGKTVIAADGQVLGEVTAFFLEEQSWRVESIQVSLRREVADRLGASRSVFRSGKIEIAMGHVQSVGDTVILSVDAEHLRRIYPGENEPAPARQT